MILTRLGNKRKLANNLWEYFPKHKMRIELFFGAGGSFFYTPPSQYAILNDFDDDVTNLYKVLLNNKAELIDEIKIMPISQSLIKYWKSNSETDPMKKALRFLLLSNFTYLGKGDTIRLGLDNTKYNLINSIEPTFQKLQNAKITNLDFRNVLDKISFSKTVMPKERAFVYLDPVYLDTEHYYNVPNWKVKDTEDCFRLMSECGIKCAMSEFNHEKVMDFASDYKMNVIPLKERVNIKNRRIEVLVTNYTDPQLKISL
ncbi:DNA adenine methylase [Aquimarina sp. 2201CG5-10]|uniref:DNA adenine methylase n=1 Tax=Aquimarina callyspongiae TaxID=3098150 RepID=UPI002AB544AC|nr:DNA adenine methylase [Aquimarina sp. 2201CG5-10]MDY8137595.1 DNA adenine methylase [Aquimarina sp. 2201CG5-10]